MPIDDEQGSPLSADEQRLLERYSGDKGAVSQELARLALSLPDGHFAEFFSQMSDADMRALRVAIAESLLQSIVGYSGNENQNIGAKMVREFRRYFKPRALENLNK